MNCLLKHAIEQKIGGKIDARGRRGIGRKQLLDELKEMRGYWKLKEEALDRTQWRSRFGRSCGLVVRRTTAAVPKLSRFNGAVSVSAIFLRHS